jgi:hypothetical protein
MQLALTNVGQTTFGKAKDEEMVRETMSEEEAFSEKAASNQHSAVSEKQNQHQNQRPFTTEGTEDTEESKTLPLMNADNRGWQGEERSRDIEFVPVQGGYGFERVRLRIEPELPGQRRPVQTTAVPEGRTAPPRAAAPQGYR